MIVDDGVPLNNSLKAIAMAGLRLMPAAQWIVKR